MAGDLERARHRWWEQFAVARSSGWGPLTAIVLALILVVLTCLGVSLSVSGATIDFGGGPACWLSQILVGYIVLRLVAAWASKTVLRLTGFLLLMAAVAGLVHLGRDSTVSDAIRDSRRSCTEVEEVVKDENGLRRNSTQAPLARPTTCRHRKLSHLPKEPEAALRGKRDAAAALVSVRQDALTGLRERAAAKSASAQTASTFAAGLTTSATGPKGATSAETIPSTDPRLAEAQVQLTAAQAALAAAPRPPQDIDARKLVASGADYILERIVGPIAGSERDFSLELGAIGWIILALIAVVGYRRLEIRNNFRYGAPIVVKEIRSTTTDDGALLAERLRGRIGMAELIEPSSVPGGAAWDEASTSLKDSELPTGKWLAAALRAIKGIAFPPAGITVSGSYVAPKDATDPNCTLTVTLVTTRDGRFLRSARFTAPPQNALDQAGDFIAADVLAFSVLTPPWARAWGSNGASLATYRMVNNSQAVTEEHLRAALSGAPANGYLRTLLASKRDLAGEAITALGLHLDNRSEFPGYLAGRYRFGASLSMMAEPTALAQYWWSADQVTRDEVVARFDGANLFGHSPLARRGRVAELPSREQCVAVLRRGGPPLDNNPEYTAQILTTIAWRDTRRLRWRLSVPALFWFALCSQGERAQWLNLAFDHVARRRWRDQITMLRWVLEARAINHSTPGPSVAKRQRRLVRRAGRRLARTGTPAPALYNGACFFALLAERTTDTRDLAEFEATAVSLLEQALRESPVPLMPPEWLARDPDLAGLATNERFNRVVQDLEIGEQSRAQR